jgi:type I restriction enzyme S subunit
VKYKPYRKYRDSGVAWLGEVPEHWEVKRLKTSAQYRVSNVDKVPSENELLVRLCNYTDVYNNEFIQLQLELMETTATPAEIEKFGLRKGDIVITKDSEDWRDIAVPALVIENSPELVCGYHLAIVRPKPKYFDSFFLFRAFQSCAVNQQFQLASTGVTRYGLPKRAIGEALFPIPPVEEQDHIASFLGRKTERIDILVAKKRTSIEKLKEKRTALISRTVTRGLPPEAALAAGLDPHPKLKPSGVEWLGDVPEHWDAKAIKWETQVQRGASPRPIDDPIYFDDEGEYAWVRISDVTSAGMYLRSTTQRLSDLGSSLSVKLNPGEIFLSIAGSVGKPCITAMKCCIHDGFVYFPKWKGDKRFLFYLFECGESYKGLGKLGTQLNLNTDTVGSIIAGFPPTNEQNFICDFLEQETTKIDQLVARIETAIEKLQEYRTALITAAVTGKIDVRESQA